MTTRRGARQLSSFAALALALGAAAGCAGEPPVESRQIPVVEPLPAATPAPALTIDFPVPVEEPAPEPVTEPAAALASAPAAAPAATSAQAGVEDRIFALANEARAAAGVGQLQRHGELDGVAQGWSQYLASGSRELAHNPSYDTQIPGGWSTAAENVAWLNDGGQYSGDQVAQSIHQGWMDSPGHRTNLLNPVFTHLGVGVVQGPNGYYLTQNFAAY